MCRLIRILRLLLGLLINKEPAIIVNRVMPLETRLLVGYLWGRGIHRSIATEHCCEVHYYLAGRPDQPYYAIGWRNDSGGYELRNRYVKQAVAPKDITTVGDLSDCPFYVFEGFIDFLSAIQLGVMDLRQANAIVLNSTALVRRAIENLEKDKPTEILCMLDNDAAGTKATDAIVGTFPQTRDLSSFYRAKNCKDVNDLLMKVKRTA